MDPFAGLPGLRSEMMVEVVQMAGMELVCREMLKMVVR